MYLYNTGSNTSGTVDVIVLQPNVDPYTEKYKTTNHGMAQKLIELSKTKLDTQISFVIAPETTLSKPVQLSKFEKTKEWSIRMRLGRRRQSVSSL